jgi:hypothetical protein
VETAVTVGVPIEDADDLAEVARAFEEPPTKLEAHPFDRAALAQVGWIVSTGGVPVLIAWIKSRTEKRKHMSINAFGIEASGYTMKELEPVLEMLCSELDLDIQ